ncbi:MAG: DUF1987 domain-containing protein [Kiritimatiellae bacterium]|nr:DUF1987 domain-containing protein [Kiritimatiellia bacterium]
MNELNLESGVSTPGVLLSADSGAMRLTGECYPENAVEFFRPVFQWLDEYMDGRHRPLKVEVSLSYFNSSSSKCLLDVVERLDEYARQGASVMLWWHYAEGDEDLLESGKELADGVSFPFYLVMDEEA